jgi:hypothetical protein
MSLAEISSEDHPLLGHMTRFANAAPSMQSVSQIVNFIPSLKVAVIGNRHLCYRKSSAIVATDAWPPRYRLVVRRIRKDIPKITRSGWEQ